MRASGSKAAISGKNRSCATTSMTPANSTATLTIKQAGSSTCFATRLAKDAFYRGLKHYLEVNRSKNVVTSDLAKAIEEATHTNVDQFFSQWLYGAGGPKFELSYSYDSEKHQVMLAVKQTQKIEGRVGLFRVPAEVEVTTASGPKLYDVTVSKDHQTFPLPAEVYSADGSLRQGRPRPQVR